MPIFYLPYLRHPVAETGRESGLLIPVVSNSSVKGFTLGEQVYIVLNRSMDMVIGAEYYSKRGFAPNGDFRYKGPGLDHLTVRWNALLDRGIAGHAAATGLVNQGGIDILANGRKDFSPETRVAGNVEYLSSYVYRLVFNDNYSQAVNSEVQSTLSLTHNHNGLMPSAYLDGCRPSPAPTRAMKCESSTCPACALTSLDRPLGSSPLYWGLGSSISHLSRVEPDSTQRNVGRIDLYPHLSLPHRRRRLEHHSGDGSARDLLLRQPDP